MGDASITSISSKEMSTCNGIGNKQNGHHHHHQNGDGNGDGNENPFISDLNGQIHGIPNGDWTGQKSTDSAAIEEYYNNLTLGGLDGLGSLTERSLIMVKPQGVRKGLVGEIIQRFNQKGAKLIALKFIIGTKEEMIDHYIQHQSESFFPALIDFMVSGPVVPMVWEGRNMVKVGRSLLGRKCFTKTIRGQFGLLPGHGNIIHGSDSVDAANREINIWFKPHELVTWSHDKQPWIYNNNNNNK